MNAYFNIDNWDFGDTFYFSELAAYIHQNIGDIVSSVVLVPLDPQKSFGDLYEIRSAPNQIFVNGATVNDIEVITALTSTNLQTASFRSGNSADSSASSPAFAPSSSRSVRGGGSSGGGGGSY
jgi:uncharacterized membrane protein YgcG